MPERETLERARRAKREGRRAASPKALARQARGTAVRRRRQGTVTGAATR